MKHPIHVQADHSGERLGRTGEALKADIKRRSRTSRSLLHNIRQHAVSRRQVQPLDDPAQQVFEADDGVNVIARRVDAEDYVAAAVTETFKDGKEDLFFIVAG